MVVATEPLAVVGQRELAIEIVVEREPDDPSLHSADALPVEAADRCEDVNLPVDRLTAAVCGHSMPLNRTGSPPDP